MLRPERGDIYHFDIPGSEIRGREFCGPHWWVVVSVSELNGSVFTAVPLTSPNNSRGEPKDRGDLRYINIRIYPKSKIPDPAHRGSAIFTGESIAQTDQVRCLSVDRLEGKRFGTLDELGLNAIEAGVLFVIGAGIKRETVNQPESVDTTSRREPIRSVVQDDPRPSPGAPAKSN